MNFLKIILVEIAPPPTLHLYRSQAKCLRERRAKIPNEPQANHRVSQASNNDLFLLKINYFGHLLFARKTQRHGFGTRLGNLHMHNTAVVNIKWNSGKCNRSSASEQRTVRPAGDGGMGTKKVEMERMRGEEVAILKIKTIS